MRLEIWFEIQDRSTEEYIEVAVKCNYIPPTKDFSDEIETPVVVFPDGLEMELEWVLNNYNGISLDHILDRANYYWSLRV